MLHKIRRGTDKEEELSAGEKKGHEQRGERSIAEDGRKEHEKSEKRGKKPINIETLALACFGDG